MQVKYHKFTGSMPIIFVERFSDFIDKIGAQKEDLEENTDYDSGNYFRTMGFKKSPLKFAIFEDAMMRTLFGHRRNDVVDATLAVYVSKRKFPLNEKLAINNAIKLTIENEAIGAYRILEKLYLNKFKVDNPYHKIAIQEAAGDAGEKAKKLGLVHIAYGYYGPDKDKEPTHKSVDSGNDLKKLNSQDLQTFNQKKSGQVPLAQQPEKSKEVKVVKKDTGEEHPDPASLSSDQSIDSTKELSKEEASGLKKLRDAIDNVELAYDKDGSVKEFITSAIDKMENGETLSDHEKTQLSQYIRYSTSGNKLYIATNAPGNFKPKERGQYGEKNVGKTLAGMFKQQGVLGADAKPSGNDGPSGENQFKKKEISPASVYTDENGNTRKLGVKISKTKNGFKIGDTEVKRIPEIKHEKIVSALVSSGVPKDEAILQADIISLATRKHNAIVDKIESVFGSGEELSSLDMVDVLPGTSPDTTDGRSKLQQAAISGLREKLSSKAGGHPLIAELEHLETLKGEEFDSKAADIIHQMWDDPAFKPAVADLVEVISYAKALAHDKVAYLPEAKNFELGDVIALSSETGNIKTVSDLLGKAQLIITSVENRSVKKGAGGASGSRKKIELSEFDPEEVKADLTKLEEQFKEIYYGDTKTARENVFEIAKKYGHDPDEILNDPKNKTSIDNAIKKIMENYPDSDEAEMRHKLETYMVLGRTLVGVYNNHVTVQMFSNEQYVNKNDGANIDVADGVSRIALLRFSFNTGTFGRTGAPGNPTATKFHHVDRRELMAGRAKARGKK